MNRTTTIIIISISVLFLLTCCCVLVGAGALALLSLNTREIQQFTPPAVTILPPATRPPFRTPIPSFTPYVPQSSTPLPSEETGIPIPATSDPTVTGSPTPIITETPLPAATSVSTGTLHTLQKNQIPASDPLDLARRLHGKGEIPPTLPPPQTPRAVGDREKFWVLNNDTNQNFQVEAILQYITEHSYFWIQDGVEYNPADLQNLAETFENQIYPTNRKFFGSEWTPGVDSDPHLHILYAANVGDRVAGYYSPNDQYNQLADEHSNSREMFVFNASQTLLHHEYTYATLAHEFQHMIHWYRDVNEELWVNEGFSDLAMLLNGYDVSGADIRYAADPDLQLTTWAAEPEGRPAHYGASFLFFTYFLDRFGDDVTQAIVAHPDNGLVSLDAVLAERAVTDPLTGVTLTADDVFADWVIANYLQDINIKDGRYAYRSYSSVPQFAETERVDSCPSQGTGRQVSQYGVDYIRIRCHGNVTLRFEGESEVPLLPVVPHSGEWAFWSHNSDVSDTTLTRAFDFSTHSGPLTLSYWTWYDIEQDYDYVYVEASLDGGATWQILNTPSGIGTDPVGNSYGWGYTGESEGWMQEQVDLSPYAGQQVQIRFEYVTDAGVTGDGFLLDDVAILETGYSADFEAGSSGWEAAGFARIQNRLPQTFRLALISHGPVQSVTTVTVLPGQVVEIPLSFNGAMPEITLAVSGTTRFTRQKAEYAFSVR